MSTLIRLLKNTCGLTSIEYAFVAVFVAVGLVIGLDVLGDRVTASYQNMTFEIRTAVGLD